MNKTIFNSPLWKSVAPYLEMSEQRNLLGVLRSDVHAELDSHSLIASFDWNSTPEGVMYWSKISVELDRYRQPNHPMISEPLKTKDLFKNE